MESKQFLLRFAFVSLLCLCLTERVNGNRSGESVASATITPEFACRISNNSCEECVKQPKCYYCYTTSQCLYYPFSHGFPTPQDCDMGQVRWAVCWFNFRALVISLSVMAGVFLVSLVICISCCCRKKKDRSNFAKYAREDARREREREEKRIRADERKNDRKLHNDEIRRKYGLLDSLMKEDAPYQRFDA